MMVTVRTVHTNNGLATVA